MSESVTCKQLIDFLDDYEAGTLPPPTRAEFERHLSECPPCVGYLKSYRGTIALAKRSAGDCGAVKMPEELVAAILKARRAGG